MTGVMRIGMMMRRKMKRISEEDGIGGIYF